MYKKIQCKFGFQRINIETMIKKIIFFALIYFLSNEILSSILLKPLSKFGTREESEVFFPKNFLFGAGSSAYQVEGGWNEDGKSESVWDKLTHEHPEFVSDHSNGDISSDSYHMYMKDIQALKSVGVS
jgi:hypothetical protein